MKIEELNRLVKLAKEKGIDIKNTPEGRKKLEMLRNSKRDGASVSANSISDKDVAKMKQMLSGFTENKPSYKGSGNSISDKDVESLQKLYEGARSSKKKKKTSTKAMKKGGVVKYTRGGSVSNFKGTY